MKSPFTLRDWLAGLDAEELTGVIERNPLVSAGAAVRDLDELAQRLTHPATMSHALASVPLPVVELVEAASALGAAATPAALVELLDDGGADPEAHREQVERWLRVAVADALLWLDDDHLHINPGVDRIVLMPLAIARPSRMLLGEPTSDELLRLLRGWADHGGQTGAGSMPTRKADRLAAVAALFTDAAAIRRVAGTAPDAVLATLTAHVNRRVHSCRSVVAEADDGERLDETDLYGGYDGYDGYDGDHASAMREYRAREELWKWATSAGLAFGRGLGFGYTIDAEMASEVYLALAPADFRTPFHPQQPPLAAPQVAAEQIERASGAAAAQFLGSAMAILEAVSRGGIKLLKTGGVGSRELTRFAKQLGCDVATLRMVLTLADRLELLDVGVRGASLATSDAFEGWRRQQPEQRMFDLVLAWLSPGPVATRDRDGDDAYVPVLKDRSAASGIPIAYILTHLVADQSTQAVASGDELAEAVIWHQPAAGPERAALRSLFSEAHLIGVLADGAVSPFAEALCAGDEKRTLDLLTRLLPAESSDVLFGSDLTVVIAGNPAADVVDVLDAVAVREGHGVANTWRITEASIRDALDNGYAVEDLTATLRSIAGTELPQALDYLLRDVARRHGRLQVHPAAAVVVCDDEALLAEVVGARQLRKLGVRLVAPTVAVAMAETGALLRALRSAGYLPVPRDQAGEPVVELRRLPQIAAHGSRGDAGRSEAGDAGHDDAGGSGPDSSIDDGVLDDGDSGAEDSDTGDSDTGDADTGDLDAELAAVIESVRGGPARAPAESAADLARRMIDAPDGDPAARTATEDTLAALTPHLSPAEVHELADALTADRAVQIRYRSQSGGETVRIVSELELIGSTLYAFCHLRNDDRQFRLDRILGVAPAGLF